MVLIIDKYICSLYELDSYKKLQYGSKKKINRQTNKQTQTDNQDMRHFFLNVELELRTNIYPPDKIFVIRGNEC